MMNDPLSNNLSMMLNREKKGYKECILSPISNLLLKILEIMKSKRYIGDYEIVEKAKGGLIKVNLIGNLNNCCVIKPRFSFDKNSAQMFEKRYLIAKGFGFLILSTSQGIMTHKEALEKGIGGKLIAYCY